MVVIKDSLELYPQIFLRILKQMVPTLINSLALNIKSKHRSIQTEASPIKIIIDAKISIKTKHFDSFITLFFPNLHT